MTGSPPQPNWRISIAAGWTQRGDPVLLSRFSLKLCAPGTHDLAADFFDTQIQRVIQSSSISARPEGVHKRLDEVHREAVRRAIRSLDHLELSRWASCNNRYAANRTGTLALKASKLPAPPARLPRNPRNRGPNFVVAVYGAVPSELWSFMATSQKRATGAQAPVVGSKLFLGFGVMLGVGFCGLSGMVFGMRGVAVRCYGMVRSLFTGSGFVVFGRLAMVVCGGLVMLGGGLVVFCNFGYGGSHRNFLLNVSDRGLNPAIFRKSAGSRA